MKTRKYSILSIAALALCFSCSKDNIDHSGEPDRCGPFEVTITGEMGEFAPGTKSTAESCIRLKWEAGDVVWAYDGKGNTLGRLIVSLDEGNDYVAKMTGTLNNVPSDGYLYLVHSPQLSTIYQMSAYSLSTTGILMATQKADVTAFVAYAIVPDVTARPQTNLKAKFSFASSILRINATGISNGSTLESACLTGINNICFLSIDGNNRKFIVSSGISETKTINKVLSGTVSSTGRASFYIGVPAFPDKTADRVLTVYTTGPDGKSSATYLDYSVLAEGKPENSYINYVYEVKNLDYIDEYGIMCGQGTYIAATHAVWAPVNCGYHATYFQYGKPYQWGRKYGGGYVATGTTKNNDSGGVVQEVTAGPIAAYIDSPYRFYTNSEGDWSYEHEYNYWDLSLTASCRESGHVPTKSRRDPCPEGWRVPTYAELAALLGYNGSIISGNFVAQSKSIGGIAQIGSFFNGTGSAYATTGIFLSAAGRRSYSAGNAVKRSTDGCYWCSSASSETGARYMAFNSSAASMGTYERAAGCAIRCVQE